MNKILDTIRFWAFKKLCRWYFESMDQHDHFRMKTSFGYGYAEFSMQPIHQEVAPENYREI